MRLGARAWRKRSIRIGAPAAQDEFGFRSGDGDGEPKRALPHGVRQGSFDFW